MEDSYLLKVYEENGVDAKETLHHSLSFIFSGRTFFKKSDLKCIHERLFITNEVFDLYLKVLDMCINLECWEEYR